MGPGLRRDDVNVLRRVGKERARLRAQALRADHFKQEVGTARDAPLRHPVLPYSFRLSYRCFC